SGIDVSVEGFYSNPNLILIITEPFGADRVMHTLNSDTKEIINSDISCLKISDHQIMVISPTLDSKKRLQNYLRSRNKLDFETESR
ncbi:MAG: hypothetical protein ABF449_10615, partial [Ethanoligenens sp.]